MGLRNFLKSLLGKKEVTTLEVSRIETPEKIIETKIRPVKFPSILELGEKLGAISHEIREIREEMMTKTWFTTQYEDVSDVILEKLDKMKEDLEYIKNYLTSLNQITKNLSKNLSYFSPTISKKEVVPFKDKVYELIVQNKRIRFKDLIKRLNVSEPTLSKYLKILLQEGKIKRTKRKKAVFYSPIQ